MVRARRMFFALAGLAVVVLVLGVMTYVRLAPVTSDDWHRPIPYRVSGAGSALIPVCGPDAVVASIGSARTVCRVEGKPSEILTRLQQIALGTARTRLVAGSVADGRMTFETRSLIWGFPDYTTVEVSALAAGTRLAVFARLRFGKADLGVNAARLRACLSALGG